MEDMFYVRVHGRFVKKITAVLHRWRSDDVTASQVFTDIN